MQSVNQCFKVVRKDCLKFIKSQETITEKFKNKDRMIKAFLIPICFWIAKKLNKKKNIYSRTWWRPRVRKNYNFFNNNVNFKKIF